MENVQDQQLTLQFPKVSKLLPLIKILNKVIIFLQIIFILNHIIQSLLK